MSLSLGIKEEKRIILNGERGVVNKSGQCSSKKKNGNSEEHNAFIVKGKYTATD